MLSAPEGRLVMRSKLARRKIRREGQVHVDHKMMTGGYRKLRAEPRVRQAIGVLYICIQSMT